MQRLRMLMGASLLLLSSVLLAQNCPSTPTYKNASGAFNLTTKGTSYVVSNGSTADVTIQNGFSSTSTICVTNGSTLNLSFQNINKPAAGGTIYVDATSRLNLVGSNMNDCPFVITSYGTVKQSTGYTFNRGGTINNYGTYTAYASFAFDNAAVTLNNSGTMVFNDLVKFNNGQFVISNTATGVLTFNGNLTLASVDINNKGKLNINGSVTLQSSTTLFNSGYLYVMSNGTFTVNKTDITNYGIIDVANKVLLNSDARLTNYCTLYCEADFENNAVVTNEGSILLNTNLPSADFKNQGTFTNGVNGFVQGYSFHNSSGTISGSGNFYFTGETRNQSAFTGSASNYINFYDVTPTSNGIFDVTNTTPKYTTKTPVLPQAISNLVSCGEPTPPVIIVQPQTLNFCDPNSANATFTVSAKSKYSSMTYQWRKNGKPIGGATSSSLTENKFKLADTADVYTVDITNQTGVTSSNSASVHFLIVAQPVATSSLIATGNTTTLSMQTSGALALQWKKNGKDLINGNNVNYKVPVVNLTDSGKYYATVTYSGGTCTTDSVVITPSIILYSKNKGNLNDVANWGVNKDGSGSTPVDFTREEHTFIVANRADIITGGNVSIAGTLDVANGNVTITPGSTLNVGRAIRSNGAGGFSGSATSSLTVHGISDSKYAGASDLYFKQGANVLQYLTTAGHAVTLRNALNITAGNNPGWLQVNSGTFNTSDSLTLKSDSLGTAIVAESYGTISGRAIIERYMPARRAWRLMCPPITRVNAPTINAAWQEGATSSTDNPHPGYGTHITYGAISDGYDQNPQKTFSMYYYNTGKWYGIPPTNKTAVTAYPAYLFFVRGDRSYDITTTTNTMTPRPTVLRTFGYFNQGQQAEVQANKDSFTLIANPYASPIDFEKLYTNSTNIKHTIRVWDPELAGSKGVGAYVTLDWGGTGYKATPPSAMSSIIQPYQAFFIQTATTNTNGKISIGEKTKSVKTVISPFGRSVTARATKDALLEINLRVFNEDSTTGIADGVLYRFNDAYNNAVDNDDVNKFSNLYENLSINNNGTLLTIDRRQTPMANDTLRLNLTSTKSMNYQLEIVPESFSKYMFLYDNYLKILSPINPTDTNHFTISINTSDALSKAANRFSIVMNNNVVLPVSFATAKAYAKAKTVQVEWTVAIETDVQYYEIQRSADGATFTKAGQVQATGTMSYTFNDATPFSGNSYYRIKSVDKSGKATYTSILPVTISNDAASHLAVYPNPVSGKTFNVELNNKKAGKYTLAITNLVGQQLFTQSVSYNGGLATYPVALKNALATGVYFIKAIAADGWTEVIKVVVQ